MPHCRGEDDPSRARDRVGKGSGARRASRGNWDVWQTALHNPSFADFAELCGAEGVRVAEPQQLDDALAEAIDHDGPALVEIIADAALV